jgi:hypothetical protein
MMGVGLSVLEFFNRSINLTIGSIAGKRMAELGDQKLHKDIALKPDGSRVWFKDWIEARGCHHYSIDIHGKNGSHPLDLNKLIKDDFWHCNFDIITNFGTAEHIDNQGVLWENIHNLGTTNSIFIHVLPEFGKYPLSHAKYFYDQEFFSSLIDTDGYTVVLNEPIKFIGHVGCCYIKTVCDSSLIDYEELSSWVKGGD